ncbi:ubi aprenyltransferase protein [Haloferula helveola]|uniref:Ubi aprenyltransferase protein n=1 Tax=Haloferula helveola TaxID=490095 RepID=A0ABM7RE16_9BACT|nr:ubi aprenyltransferase protein [Haloferula helveola]
MSRTAALLASLRVANAPSVVCNVTIGYLLGRYYWGDMQAVGPVVVPLVLAGLALYFAGNLANDWFDRDWDKTHRPERALPSGLISADTYLTSAVVLGMAGIGLGFSQGPRSGFTAIAVLVCIAIYTRIHKATVWGVLPMGLCRAGLYVMGFVAAWPSEAVDTIDLHAYGVTQADVVADTVRSIAFVATHALGLLIYISGLSLSARCESLEHPPVGTLILSRSMLFLPLAAMSAWWIPWYPLLGVAGMVSFAIWLGLSLTVFRKPIPRFVSALLAGIPLTDFIAAVPLGATFSVPGESLSLAGGLAFILPPLAFLSALLLQRFTPAT